MKTSRAGLLAALLLTAAPAEAACKLNKIIDLPVTLRGMQPLTQVSMNNHPMQLMVDSGAFFSLLTPGTAADLALPQSAPPPGFYLTGVGGTVQPTIGTVRNFQVGGTTLHNLEFLVGGSEGSSAGVIGQNILHFRDVEYDLGAGMVRLMDSHDCGHANLAYWAKSEQVSVIPLQAEGEQAERTAHTIGTISVNGVPIHALFDTGASTSFLTVAAAARAGVHVGDAEVKPAGNGYGIGRNLVKNWVGTFDKVAIGGEEIRRTRIRIAQVADADYDMLVGADFFLSHHVYVANTLHRLFVTYNGGPVFRLRDGERASAGQGSDLPPARPPASVQADGARLAPVVEAAASPTDADGFARRGAARLARRDRSGALADLDEAVKRAPGRPDLLLQRAQVHLALDQRQPAQQDVDSALATRPDDLDAHMLRGWMRLGDGNREGARADADAVARLAGKAANVRLGLATLYQQLDLFPQSIEQDSLWIAAHPDDVERTNALNERCWSRALGNRELPLALADCDAALRHNPDEADILDSRGLVHLRLGQYDKAIADFDHALTGSPRLATSLYERGLARIAKGDAATGRADMAAAIAIRADMADWARRYGLAPPS